MYLPPSAITPTTMPKQYGRDLALAIRVINERYTRHYPAITYTPIDRSVTRSATLDTPSGSPGTQYDPLYGEAIDATMTAPGQPHGTDYAAADVDVFKSPVVLHARVRRDAKETDLKRWGFEKVRDLVLYVPLSLLDAAGVTVGNGDKFAWGPQEFTVNEYNRDGYWKNTNVPLYMVLNAEHRRKGS